jgi:hypothetical protein
MRILAAGVFAVAFVFACKAAPDSSPMNAGQGAPDPADAGPPTQPLPGDLTCAERLYTFPVGTQVDGPVPCAGHTCIESAPTGLAGAFIAGSHGALWAIADGMSGAAVPTFLRQQGDRWVSTCPPAMGRFVTAAYGMRGNDVWIGGPGGALAHWDGVAWTRTASPASGDVTRIWGDGREAFASIKKGALLHWDGSTWSDTGANGSNPWGNGSGRAWALGADASLIAWNGSRWENVTGIAADSAVRDVWAPPGGDVWVLVSRPSASSPRLDEPWNGSLAVLRRNSGVFVDMGLPPTENEAAAWIRGSSATDAWIGASPHDLHSPNSVYRWDGKVWTKTTTWSWRAPHVLPGGEALVWADKLERLDGAPAEPRFDPASLAFQTAAAVGQDVWLGGGSGLWRLEGRSFRRVDSNASNGSPVISLAVRAADDVWAERGSGDLEHWNGTELERIAPPAGGWSLRGVVSAGPGRAWSVGAEWVLAEGNFGNWTAWRWDGSWSSIPTPRMSFAAATASGLDGDLWVVNREKVWHFDGKSWEGHDLPGRELRIIAVTGRTDVWVSGNGLLHYDGVQWHDAGTLTVGAFGARASDDIWAVASPLPDGLDWDLWHWDGRAWTRQYEGFLPLALAAVGRGEIWGAGGGSIMHRRPPADR